MTAIPKPKQTALLLTLLIALTLIAMGLHMLTLPDITRFRQWPYYLLPRGEILIAAAILLIVFYNQFGHYVLWIGNKVYRVVAALLVFALIGADGLLHMFSIPHVEGWWLPFASSLIAASGISAWIENIRKARAIKNEARH